MAADALTLPLQVAEESIGVVDVGLGAPRREARPAYLRHGQIPLRIGDDLLVARRLVVNDRRRRHLHVLLEGFVFQVVPVCVVPPLSARGRVGPYVCEFGRVQAVVPYLCDGGDIGQRDLGEGEGPRRGGWGAHRSLWLRVCDGGFWGGD
jgi:hypothetical protein